MDLDKAINQRRSVRKFNSKTPDWRDIIECIDVARQAPMAGGLYTLKFILVDDKEKIEKLAEAAQQPFISQAQFVVVACTDQTRTLNAYPEFSEKFCRQQAGAAIENFLLKIEEKGLATCWIGYFVEYLVKDILKVPENIQVEAFFPVGYAFEKSRPKRKPGLDTSLFFNKYNQKKMNEPYRVRA
jgi:nitroreductase